MGNLPLGNYVMQLSNDIIELINYVIEYVDGETDDWLVIRNELIRIFPPKERSRFSRRHYSTKLPILNDFDEAVIEYWEKKTGDELVIDESKLHPEDWQQKPKGWGLQAYNEARRKRSSEKDDCGSD